jgi:excinuclease ABC subunit A
LIDRLSITDSTELRQRIVDATELAYRESREIVFESAASDGKLLRFSEKFSCKTCDTVFVDPEPNLFSFNSPAGACPRCQGFGNTIDYSPARVIPDQFLSIQGGAVLPWTRPQYKWGLADFVKFAKGKVRLDVAYNTLNEAEKAIVWRGVLEFFAEVETKKYKVHVRVFLSKYRGYADCNECGGARVRKEALNVRIGGETIAQNCPP